MKKVNSGITHDKGHIDFVYQGVCGQEKTAGLSGKLGNLKYSGIMSISKTKRKQRLSDWKLLYGQL